MPGRAAISPAFVQFWLVNSSAPGSRSFFPLSASRSAFGQRKAPDQDLRRSVPYRRTVIFPRRFPGRLAPGNGHLRYHLGLSIIIPFFDRLVVRCPSFLTLGCVMLSFPFNPLCASARATGSHCRPLGSTRRRCPKTSGRCRFAGHQAWGPPFLLQGEKVLGYRHLWTQFFDFRPDRAKTKHCSWGRTG